ncbi:MAG: hypothetical protein Q9212_002620 [Teloschistes hypoglaucus]
MCENTNKQGTKRTIEEMASEDHAKDDTTGQQRCGKRLKSTQFTLFVGPSKENYLIHEHILGTSPVLSRMCSDAKKNNTAPHIELLDEDPDDFGSLLDFLYGSDFDSLGDAENFKAATAENQSEAMDELRRIYMLGEKYQLPTLKDCVVGKFRSAADIKMYPLSFLNVAKTMYSHILDSDSIYSDFLVETAQTMLGELSLSSDVRKWINEQAPQAGRMARDLFVAQRKVYETQRKQQERVIAQWSMKFETVDGKLTKAYKRMQNMIDHHEEEHDYDCEWEG